MTEPISYDKSLTVGKNVKRYCDIAGITLEDIAAKAGMSRQTVVGWMTYNFRTATGAKSAKANKLRRILDPFFVGGIPDLSGRKSADLFEKFGCAECTYRMRSASGCLKFGISREEMNRGYYVHTNNYGNFFMALEKPCLYAK